MAFKATPEEFKLVFLRAAAGITFSSFIRDTI
jgi:hypothetical protein